MERRVIFFLYRLLQAIGFPFLLLYLLWRVARDIRYGSRLAERFGWLPFQPTERGGIWLHAVSVGEVLSAAGLIRELRRMLPATPVYVSVTTLAGRELADDRLKDLADGIFFTPIDYCFAVRRVLRTLDPLAIVILETEIWPNLWNETRRRHAGLLVINGRISDAAFPRYQRWRWAFAPVLRLPRRIIAQSEQDAARYRALGALQVETGGNLKYDIAVPAPRPELAEWIRRQAPAKVFIAASTMPAVTAGDREEDEIVVDAFQYAARRHPRLLMILAPRRPERFYRAAALLRDRGVAFVRRSQLAELPLPGVLLLDSMGELAGLFALADTVFVGGSLVHWGGHNVLEPAASARPILVGPYMQNFAAIAGEFHAAQALRLVPDPAALGEALSAVLVAPGELGANAQRAAQRHRGAATAAAQAIAAVLDQSVTRETGRRWLHPFTWLWRLGVAADRWLRTKTKPLPVPVISVGNLTVGGTGKTPHVDWLARHLPGSAILTRGYGRQDASRDLVLAPGETAPVAQTGDEAQTYLQSGAATVGIGVHRRQVAERLLQAHPPQRFLLDDGFQHWPLPRQRDILLIDTTDPFGGGHLLPRGRLREPNEAILRAHAVVLTRCEPNREYTALVEAIRRVHPKCPIFRSRIVAGEWQNGPLPPGPYTVVSGLANPGAFRATLRQLGVQPDRAVHFPDHHNYSAEDLAALPEPILTTQKDWVKIAALNLDKKVLWLSVDLQIDDAGPYLQLLQRGGTESERVSGSG